MGKKGTKRKTRWRTLSIDSADGANAAPVEGNAGIKDEIGESRDSNYRYSNTSHTDQKQPFGSSINSRSEARIAFSKSHYNQSSIPSSSSSYSSRNSYRRRQFGNGNSRYFGYKSGGRFGSQYSRTSESNKENNQDKPIFNEEEYTRITTPRQDVIFKKGYLSQPRKYLSSTDTNTTSSAAASVVSTEESFSATSAPSLSPEQCSSYADSLDPEQAYIYSYIDQNGVLYLNPYLPNGFDQYTGQMLMLPYNYQPYNVYPPDVGNPAQSTENEESTVLTDSSDSNESLPGNKDNDIKDTNSESSNNCDLKMDSQESTKSESNEDEVEKKDLVKDSCDDKEKENTQVDSVYNYGMQPIYPPYYFPYMYGQPIIPIVGYDSFDQSAEENSNENEDECLKKQSVETEEGKLVDEPADCSTKDCENKDTDASEENGNIEETSCDTVKEVKSECNEETVFQDEKKVVLNADVEEFIPRFIKPHLNVNVKEFLPKSYRSDASKAGEVQITRATKDKDGAKLSSKRTLSTQKNVQNSASNKTNRKDHFPLVEQPHIVSPQNSEEPKNLTLAERIKKGFSDGSTHSEKSSPPKSSFIKLENKKIIKGNEKRNGKQIPPTTSANKTTITIQKPVAVLSVNSNSEKNPAKNISKNVIEKKREPKDFKPPAPVENKNIDDEWQTVKVKGKRNKHTKEFHQVDEELTKNNDEGRYSVKEAAVTIVEKVQEPTIVAEPTEIDVLPKTKPQNEVPAHVKVGKAVATVDVVKVVEEVVESVPEIVSSPKNGSVEPNVQNSQKKLKVKNKKPKKSTNSVKKVKEKDETRNKNNSSIDKKTEMKAIESSSIAMDEDDIKEVSRLLIRPKTSVEDVTLDSLYFLDRKNSRITNNFCRNPLEILNGFDCKFKVSSSILKEEEEMVLNVIKSLSTNQSIQQESRNSETNFSSDHVPKNKENDVSETIDCSLDVSPVSDAMDDGSTNDNENDCTSHIENDENMVESLIPNGTIRSASISDLSECTSRKNEIEEDEAAVAECDQLQETEKPSSENTQQSELPQNCLISSETSCEDNLSSNQSIIGHNVESSEEANLEEPICININGGDDCNNVNCVDNCDYAVHAEAFESPFVFGDHTMDTTTENLVSHFPEANCFYKDEDLEEEDITIIENLLEDVKMKVSTSNCSTVIDEDKSASLQSTEESVPVEPTASLEDITTTGFTEEENTAKNSDVYKEKNNNETSLISKTDPLEQTDYSPYVHISTDEMEQKSSTANEQITNGECSTEIKATKYVQEVDKNAYCVNSLDLINHCEIANSENSNNGEQTNVVPSCISPANDSGIVCSLTTGNSVENVSHAAANPVCNGVASISQCNSPTDENLKSNCANGPNFFDPPSSKSFTAPEEPENSGKYPLTTAVLEWLNGELKEKSPEPIFRVPSDPKISTLIASSILDSGDYDNDDEDWSSEEEEGNEVQEKVDGMGKHKEHSKNLQSNPSHVSSVNKLHEEHSCNDNDSDYNSDGQQKHDADDNTCERVATNSTEISKSDLLDYWDDEFIRNPKNWLVAGHSSGSEDKESVFSTTPSENLTPYESVYGKTIDYDQLLANNCEFLSKNIISFNNINSKDKMHASDSNVAHETLLDTFNNINNDNVDYSNLNDKNNCLKPPEVCCIIM